MITPDPRKQDPDRPSASLYLWRNSDGIIMLVDDQGRVIEGQVLVSINQGVDEITSANVVLYPEGWYDD